ncbi:hypothetical protein OROMI_006381 [Orobanche minor]
MKGLYIQCSLIGNVFRDGATKKADITFQICNQVFSPIISVHHKEAMLMLSRSALEY